MSLDRGEFLAPSHAPNTFYPQNGAGSKKNSAPPPLCNSSNRHCSGVTVVRRPASKCFPEMNGQWVHGL